MANENIIQIVKDFGAVLKDFCRREDLYLEKVAITDSETRYYTFVRGEVCCRIRVSCHPASRRPRTVNSYDINFVKGEDITLAVENLFEFFEIPIRSLKKAHSE